MDKDTNSSLTGKVVVTGGAGFIGSHLCESLLENGYQVIVIDNLITGKIENIKSYLEHPRFRFLKWDVTKPLPSLLTIDYIFHLASPASPKTFSDIPVEILMVNSIGTYHLLELARENKARIIFASSSEVYGEAEKHPQTEEYWGNVNPIGCRSCYDEAKRFAEALCVSYQRKYKLSVGIARIFNTYGPRMREDDGRFIPNFIHQALAGKPITIYGDGKQTRSCCYISDLVNGLLLLMKSNYSGPINLGNTEERSVLGIAQCIKKLTNSSSSFSYLPLQTDAPSRRQPNISKAKEVLGWYPKIGFNEGVKHTIDWYTTKTPGYF